MVIYITTNLINGKKYIGKSINCKNSYLGSGKIFKQALKKYGKQNFKKEILEECLNEEELNKQEIYWINKYNANNDENFYNITEGGEGCSGFKHSDDFIKKMKTLERSDTWKKNISKGLTGIKHTAERIENNRLSQIGLQAGIKNPRAKIFIFKSPDNEEIKVHGCLKKFAESIGMRPASFFNLINKKWKQYKGWTYIGSTGNQ